MQLIIDVDVIVEEDVDSLTKNDLERSFFIITYKISKNVDNKDEVL